jgi:prolyl-tRNA editing enzyme YbaK/EbsC (Cys-tRNA(Pro) deacylase)
MTKPLRASAEKVQQAVLARGFDFKIVEFDQSTRTAADAAATIGCTVAQIAKSLVFKKKADDTPVLVIASGANRVDLKKVGEYMDGKIIQADADFVRQSTGYTIGGVPPIGHDEPILTLVDEDLFTHQEIWAAAGTPYAVFRLTPKQLLMLTGGTVLSIR